MKKRGGKREGAGRPKFEATKLREALIREAEKNAELLAKVLVDKALSGQLPALKEIIDRGIGKSVQYNEHTGKDGSNLFSGLAELCSLEREEK